MLKRHEIGEAQRVETKGAPRFGNGGDLCVGGAEKNQIRRRLPKINRLLPLSQCSLLGEEQMHGLERRNRRLDRRAVETFETNDHQPRCPRLAFIPCSVEIGVDPCARRLHNEPHRLALDGCKAL